MLEKTLNNYDVESAKKSVPDLEIYGDGNLFKTLAKASSNEQGWMKTTKVHNVHGGCVMQVTTQQRNPDGSYALSDAITYVPGVQITEGEEPPTLVRAEW